MINMDIRRLPVDPEVSLGNLVFLGLKREKYYFDREKGQLTDKLEARIYNLASDLHQGQIEVTLPEHKDLKEIEFMKKVKVRKPIMSVRGQANNNFVNIIWRIDAEDIVEDGSTSSINTSAGKNE